ncbi:MAG TPA: F0F1 ATP synthase subunit B [Spirochaetota bacterium]|nr:F0F1 ATP synthase subunit B [Spirochaetota bacterium]HSA13101.1 F0F1 ATP synthase subunit B [Spirochaetota bacterium]
MAVIKEGLLKVDPGLFLWTVITFAVLVLLLWKTAWRPIVDALDARAEKVRGDIENAENARVEAEKVLSVHRQEMAKAKDDAADIIAKGREEAEKMKNEIVEKANKEASTIVDRARKEIDLAKENALSDIKNEVVLLSTEIASKIISKNINPDDQKALVQEALNKMRTVQ